MLKYLKYGFLPSVLQPGFTAAHSATGREGLQPCRPGGSDVLDSAIIRQGRWYSSTMMAKYTRGESAGDAGRWLE